MEIQVNEEDSFKKNTNDLDNLKDQNIEIEEQNGIMKSAQDFKIEIEVELNGQQQTQIADQLLQSQSSNSSAFNQNPSCPANTQQNYAYSQKEEEDDIQEDQESEDNNTQENNFLSPFNHNKISTIEVYHQEPFLEIPIIPKSLHDDSFLMEQDDIQEYQQIKNQSQNNIQSYNQVLQNNQILNSSESNISTPETDKLSSLNEINMQKHNEIFDFQGEIQENLTYNTQFQGNFNNENENQIIRQLENCMILESQLNDQQYSQHLTIFKFLNSYQEKVLNVIHSFINKINAKLFIHCIQKFQSLFSNKIESIKQLKENVYHIQKYISENQLIEDENNFYNNQQFQEMEVCHKNTNIEKLNLSAENRQFINFYKDEDNYHEGEEKDFYKENDIQNIEAIKQQQRIQLFENGHDSSLKETEIHDNQIIQEQIPQNQYEKIIEFDWNPQEKFRAKLYTLDQEGRWHDRGTGNFKIEHIGYQQYKMTLLQEQDNQIDLLKNEIIQSHITFHRQRETIITWSDKQREQDLAVSFQNNSGAQYTWHKICQILDVDPDQNTQDSQNQEEEAEEFSQITLESLPRLAEELKNVQQIDSEAKQEICDHFLANEAQKLIKLGELFEECEIEMKDKTKVEEEILLNFFHIYKGLIQLNDERLLEILMSDKFYMYTFGALEWDPEALEQVREINEQIQEDQEQFQQEPELERLPINDQSNLDELSQPEEELEENKKQQNQEMNHESDQGNISAQKFEDTQIQDETEGQKNQSSLNIEQISNQEQQQQTINNNLIQNEEMNENINQIKIPKYFTSLNYREFLSKTVKFNKVVEFKPQQAKRKESHEKQQNFSGYQEHKNNQYNQFQNQYGNTENNFDIEERIHINYRLAYLKDTVMARYIDDTALKIINQLIQSNNREIVSIIFGLNINQSNDSSQYGNNIVYGSIINKQNQNSNYGLAPWGGYNSNQKTIKDQIVEKIKSKTNIKERFQAIEFMIELCQILKSFQFQSNFLGGNPSFQYNNGSIGFNCRQITDQLNHVNLIGLLAESFGIFVPNQETLEAHLRYQKNSDLPFSKIQLQEYNKNLIKLYQQQYPNMETYVIEDLLEFTQERNDHESKHIQINLAQHGATRVDKMKINSMEIIISFYQNTHIPNNDISKFVLGEEQKQRGLPFLNNLVSHLIYSPEQGIKTQICDFFKSLLDCEQSSLNNISSKEQLYKNVLRRFVQFLKQFEIDEAESKIVTNDIQSIEFRQTKFKSLEYSIYLIMQILNKVVSEHRYPFKTFMIQNEVIQTVGNLSQINSKLVNIEIVKFYKSLLKSKDPSYIQMITQKNLFNPVFDIFEINFKEIRPPMILSCIRDLFEHIFRSSMGKNQMNNDLYNQKLVDYLIRINQRSKSIIFNPIYKSIFKKYDLNDDRQNFIIDDNEIKNLNNNASSPQPDRESDQHMISPVSPCSDYSDSDLGSQNCNDSEDCIGLQYSKSLASTIGPMGLALQQKQQNSFINKRQLNGSLQSVNSMINRPIYSACINDLKKSDLVNEQNKIKTYEDYQMIQQQENDKINKQDELEQGSQQKEKGNIEILNQIEIDKINNQYQLQSQVDENEYKNKYNVSIRFGDQYDLEEQIEKRQKGNNLDELNKYMQYPLSDNDEDLAKGALSPIGSNKQLILKRIQNQFQNEKRFKSENNYFSQIQTSQNGQIQSQSGHIDNSEFLLDLQNEPEDEIQNEFRSEQKDQNQQIQIQINPLQINDILKTQKLPDQANEDEKFENIERIELEKENIGNDNQLSQIQKSEQKDTTNIGEDNQEYLNSHNEVKVSKNNSYNNTGQSNKQNIQNSSDNYQSQISDVSQLSQNSPPSFQLNPSIKNSGQKDALPFENVSCSSSDHLYNLLDKEEIVQDLGIFNIDLQQTYANRQQSIDLNGQHQSHTKLIYLASKSPGIVQKFSQTKSENAKYKSQIQKSQKYEIINRAIQQKSIDDSQIAQKNEINEIISESISNQDNESERQETLGLEEEIEMSNNDDSQPIKLGIKRSINSCTGEIIDQQNGNIHSSSDQVDSCQDQSLQKRLKTDEDNV